MSVDNEIDMDGSEPPLPKMVDGRTTEQLKAGGAECPPGDMQFTSKEGVFSEEIAQQRIRWLLRCEKAIESMAGQICSPKTTAADMVVDILGDQPRRKGRASR